MKEIKVGLGVIILVASFILGWWLVRVASHQLTAATITRWEDKDGICYMSGGDRISCISKERQK